MHVTLLYYFNREIEGDAAHSLHEGRHDLCRLYASIISSHTVLMSDLPSIDLAMWVSTRLHTVKISIA